MRRPPPSPAPAFFSPLLPTLTHNHPLIQSALHGPGEKPTGKAAVQAQRISRLAARNPKGIERQIADLKALPSPNARDKKNLEDAERELARMQRAREIVGKNQNQSHGHGQNEQRQHQQQQNDQDRTAREREVGGGWGRKVLRKRRWDGGVGGEQGRSYRGPEGSARLENGDGDEEESGGDTDASVRAIPMPKDTPPPIPHPARNRNHPRPNDHHHHHAPNSGIQEPTSSTLTNANLEPLSSARGLDTRPLPSQAGSSESSRNQPAAAAAIAKPAPPPKTVYEAKPMVRDLRKEAVNKFVPEAVRRRKMIDPAGQGGVGETRLAPAAAEAVETETEMETEMEMGTEMMAKSEERRERENLEETTFSSSTPHSPPPHPSSSSPPPIQYSATQISQPAQSQAQAQERENENGQEPEQEHTPDAATSLISSISNPPLQATSSSTPPLPPTTKTQISAAAPAPASAPPAPPAGGGGVLGLGLLYDSDSDG